MTLEELKEKRRGQGKGKKGVSKTGVVLLCSLSAAVAATVVLLCVFLIKPATENALTGAQTPMQEEVPQEQTTPPGTIENENPAKEYTGEYDVVLDCTAEEINAELAHFTVQQGNSPFKKHLNERGEVEYYYFTYHDENDLSTLHIKFFFDPDVLPPWVNDMEYERKGTVASYECEYVENVECDEGIYFFMEIGKIFTDHEILYIEGDIIGFEEDSGFLEMLNEIVKEKEN